MMYSLEIIDTEARRILFELYDPNRKIDPLVRRYILARALTLLDADFPGLPHDQNYRQIRPTK